MYYFLEISQQAVYLVLLISGIPLLLAVVGGLIVSILQAATSIQEQTTCYLIRLASLVLSLFFCGRWFSQQILDFINICLQALSRNFIQPS